MLRLSLLATLSSCFLVTSSSTGLSIIFISLALSRPVLFDSVSSGSLSGVGVLLLLIQLWYESLLPI